MGVPTSPQGQAADRQAATWVAGDAVHPTKEGGPYVSYGYAPPPGSSGGSAYQPPFSNPYVQTSPVPNSTAKRTMDTVAGVLNKLGKRLDKGARKAEGYAGNVWQHLKTSPHPADAAMGRIAQGTKAFIEGGQDKIFHHTFETLPGEVLRKSFVCYLSTSSGPVIGTLYLSTNRLAFCSDNPLCYSPQPGQQSWCYYKVIMLHQQLAAVTPSSNRLNPTEKYIQIVTSDGLEFWFMGFVSYDKALNSLTKVLQRSGPSHT
ncbi:unnamed protein product [Victoria cruziana]